MTTTTSPLIPAANGSLRLDSQTTPHRYWALFHDRQRGCRTVIQYDRDERGAMQGREVAYLRTRQHRTENSAGWGLHTTVTWEVFLYRWMDRVGANYPSDRAAFRAFCQSRE